MFIKKYKYHLLPGKIEEFLKLQEEANAIYQKHVDVRIELMQSNIDPGEIVEIQYLPDKASYDAARKLLDADPCCMALYKRFEALLDPKAPPISEEDFESLV